jgi:predicted proteasome-type protease
LVQPVQDQVFNAIREISEGRQYDFIFDKSADVVMLYAAERFDISDQVIRMINRAAKREQAENKKEKQAIEQRDSLNEEQDRELTEREKARKERDSIREARQKEAEERRQKQVEERQRRQDSIQKARNKN